MEQIREQLLSLADEDYKRFHAKLMPTVNPDRIIGIRMPILKKFAKDLYALDMEENNGNNVEVFLSELPHHYYEENNLHCELLKNKYKKKDTLSSLLDEIDRFLPYIDNWATCDSLSPKLFKKDYELTLKYVQKWLDDSDIYAVRFGIVTLMDFYLDEKFEPWMLEKVSKIKSEEYYINMAIAWYFSFALIKQYDYAIQYFTSPVMDKFVHNKSIRKAIESRRISDETKEYLRSLSV